MQVNRTKLPPRPVPELTLPAQRAVSYRTLAQLVLVMLLWALCFPLIATGLSVAPPLYFAALRSFVAGVGLLLPAFILRRPLPQGHNLWLSLLGVGLTTTSLGFSGMFLAGGVVSPGLATVLANVQPLMAAGLAYLVLRDRLGPRRWLGLSVGLAGIILIAFASSGSANTNSTPFGVGYVLLGAVGVAVGNVLLKCLAGRVDLLMATGWQFVLGGTFLFGVALIFETPAQVVWSPSFVVVLLVLGLLGTALPLALWFSLLHQGDLTRFNTFTFLTPLFALGIGVAFFNESLGLIEMSGIGLILAGLWVSRR